MRSERVHGRGADVDHHARHEEKGRARESLADERVQAGPVTAISLGPFARRVGDDGVAAPLDEGSIRGGEGRVLERNRADIKGLPCSSKQQNTSERTGFAPTTVRKGKLRTQRVDHRLHKEQLVETVVPRVELAAGPRLLEGLGVNGHQVFEASEAEAEGAVECDFFARWEHVVDQEGEELEKVGAISGVGPCALDASEVRVHGLHLVFQQPWIGCEIHGSGNERLTMRNRLPRFVSHDIDEDSRVCCAEVGDEPNSERITDFSSAPVVETSSESKATS